MRLLVPVLLLVALCGAPVALAQNAAPRPDAQPADVATVDGIIEALYASISGPVGQARQWERFYSLFHPQARLVPTGCPEETRCVAQVLTPEQYHERADSVLTALGFREREITKRVERYGAIAHAFSSYDSFRYDETEPFSRGINSIQLFWDGTRWWVLSIFWDAERPGNPLPAAFAGPTD